MITRERQFTFQGEVGDETHMILCVCCALEDGLFLFLFQQIPGMIYRHMISVHFFEGDIN